MNCFKKLNSITFTLLFISHHLLAQTITTVAGNGNVGHTGDGFAATSATMFFPWGITVDASNNIFFVDNGNNCIREVIASTGMIINIAGTGSADFGGDGGPANSINTKLNSPQAVAVDAIGNIYIADTYNSRIRKIDASTGFINTIAGNGQQGFSGDGGPATAAKLSIPSAVAVDASGNVYIGDFSNYRVRKIDAVTNIITTIAGTGTVGYTGDGGLATLAKIAQPQSLCIDAAGNIYIALDNVVRKIDASGIISTVAGSGASVYNGDGGTALTANINTAKSVTVDAAGNIYIADLGNGRIRKVDVLSGIISTIAGTGINGFNADNIVATSAKINSPYGIAVDVSGNLYIADRSNQRIRKVSPQPTWTGSISSDWATPANWSLNAVPLVSDNFTITLAANMPIIANGTIAAINNLEISGSTSLIINGTLQVKGSLNNKGTLNVTAGTIEMNGSNIQNIAANTFRNNSILNLKINNSFGVNLLGSLNITGEIIPTLGTLYTNSHLTMHSDENGTARVAAGSTSGGYISGNVNVNRYIQAGLRKFRFLGHPFDQSMNLTEISDDIDITGTISGNNQSGFTATGSNSPSAFSFSEPFSNGAVNDAGWVPFQSGSFTSSITPGQGIRVLVRGEKGQLNSLNGGSYTPNAVTLSMNGSLRQGDFNQNLSFTSLAKGWNLISNPYASNIDWSNVGKTNVNNSIYIYSPSTSNYASWVNGSSTNGGSNIIELGSAFFVRTNAVSPQLIWHETDKTSNTQPNSMLRTNTIHNRFKLQLKNSTTNASDDVIVRFGDDPATDSFDSNYDAYNLPISNDLYVIDKDKVNCSIYHGSELKSNLEEHRKILLGLSVTAGSYSISAQILNAFVKNNIAYLQDSLENKVVEINDSLVYQFNVSETATIENRFSIVFNAKIKTQSLSPTFNITLSPNPVKNFLTINFEGLNSNTNSLINILNMEGKIVQSKAIGLLNSGSEKMNVESFSSGVYNIQLVNGNESRIIKFIRQ
jgi:sugar lactone lactonase YvrE